MLSDIWSQIPARISHLHAKPGLSVFFRENLQYFGLLFVLYIQGITCNFLVYNFGSHPNQILTFVVWTLNAD